MESSELLWESVKTGDEGNLCDLMKRGVSVNTQSGQYNMSPLHYCAKTGNTSMFKCLLDHCADVEATDDLMDTVLHYACMYNQIDIVETIIENGMFNKLMNIKGKIQRIPLFSAIETGNVTLIKTLLQNGCEVRTQDSCGTSPLDVIMSLVINEEDRVQIVNEMLKTNKRNTMLEISEYIEKHPETKELHHINEVCLCELTKTEKRDLLIQLARLRCMLTIQKMKADLDYIDDGDKKETVLHILCSNRDLSAVHCLLDCGAKADIQDSAGWTPYHIAISNCHWVLLDMLLQYNGDLNLKTTQSVENIIAGVRPICLVKVYPSNLLRIQALLTHGADPKLTDESGNNYLHHVLSNARSDCLNDLVRFILIYFKDIDVVNKIGYSPLHLAVKRRSLDVVTIILQKGCSINLQTYSTCPMHPMYTALHLAAQCNCPYLTKLLINSGADVFITDKNGKTAFDLCMNGINGRYIDAKVSMIPHMIMAGNHSNFIDGDYWLSIFIQFRNLAYFLLQSGSFISFTDSNEGLHSQSKDSQILIRNAIEMQKQSLLLMRIAANVIRKNARPNAICGIKHLPLPGSLKTFVILSDFDIGFSSIRWQDYEGYSDYYLNDI